MDKMKIIVLLSLPTVLISCITTYRNFPVTMVGKPPESKPYSTLYYTIKKFPVLDAGGHRALRSVFRSKSNFSETVKVAEMPPKGIYCVVDVQYTPPGLPALIFGYVSVGTLTFVPAWSLHDGYVVAYHVFMDGEKKRTFEYEITRKVGLWAFLLPLAWVNVMTYSEAEAFEATAYQFFEDAKPIFQGPRL